MTYLFRYGLRKLSKNACADAQLLIQFYSHEKATFESAIFVRRQRGTQTFEKDAGTTMTLGS